MRAMSVDDARRRSTQTGPVPVDGVNYTVKSEAKWVTDDRAARRAAATRATTGRVPAHHHHGDVEDRRQERQAGQDRLARRAERRLEQEPRHARRQGRRPQRRGRHRRRRQPRPSPAFAPPSTATDGRAARSSARSRSAPTRSRSTARLRRPRGQAEPRRPPTVSPKVVSFATIDLRLADERAGRRSRPTRPAAVHARPRQSSSKAPDDLRPPAPTSAAADIHPTPSGAHTDHGRPAVPVRRERPTRSSPATARTRARPRRSSTAPNYFTTTNPAACSPTPRKPAAAGTVLQPPFNIRIGDPQRRTDHDATTSGLREAA